MSDPMQVRRSPCATCPYRRDVPSGVWDEREYALLPQFDGDTAYQRPALFCCHNSPDSICAGWAGHKDPHDLLALRLGVARGKVSPDALKYSTKVPLFGSGQEARDHGMKDYDAPAPEAVAAGDKIIKARRRRSR